MATEILDSFGNLQHQLEQAKNSLRGVDENIKRLIGRDPSELPPRPNLKRLPLINDDKGRAGSKIVRRNFENEEPANKRRPAGGISVFKRLSDRPSHDSSAQTNPRQLISKVIVTPKEVPSRQEALDAQSKDTKYRDRNRRMFGALLGTLQKFQQEETKLKKREEKREKIEKKIEEHEIKEKEEIKKERQELFYNRRKKQAEIKMIELKMLRMREYAAWEERQKPRKNFIMTRTKPHIHFLPRRLNNTTKELLEKSKAEVEKIIERRKQGVVEELKHIEERMRRNFDAKFGSKINEEQQQQSTNEDGNYKRNHDNDDHSDEDNDGDALMTEMPTTNENDSEENKEKSEGEPMKESVKNGDSEEKPIEEDDGKNDSSTETKMEESVEKTDESCVNTDNAQHSPIESQELNANEDNSQSANI